VVAIIGAIANIFSAIKEMARTGGNKDRLLYLPDWYYQQELAESVPLKMLFQLPLTRSGYM